MASAFDDSNETGKILVNLLEAWFGFQGKERVVNYNQKWLMPEDDGLYLVVRFLWSKPFGSKLSYTGTVAAGDYTEIVSTNTQEHYALEIQSASTEARARKLDLLLALTSTQSVQAQEDNQIKFANLPTRVQDTSYSDGAARINRFSVEVNVLRAYKVTRKVEYYDKFQIPPNLIINP